MRTWAKWKKEAPGGNRVMVKSSGTVKGVRGGCGQAGVNTSRFCQLSELVAQRLLLREPGVGVNVR